MIYFILCFFIVVLALVYNYFKYNDAKTGLNQVKKYFMQKCKKNIRNIVVLDSELSEKEKLFLNIFSKYLECNNLPYFLNEKMYNIFCMNEEEIKHIARLEQLAYKFRKYYCTSNIYDVLYFIDELYHKYKKNHKNLDFKLLNIKLFGKDDINDDELLDKILDMTLKEFIITFSLLMNTNKSS